MKKLVITCIVVFLCCLIFYFLILKPDKYENVDMHDAILNNGVIKVGINTDIKPFGFINEKGEVCGFDADLARGVAQYILHDRNAVKFIPVTPNNRLIKLSTGEVDIVIATMTITPQREEIINFSTPYDSAGLAILVNSTSLATTISDLADQNIGVVWGTTAEKNMLSLVPSGHIIGFKTYREAYNALKQGNIVALTSDDTILSGYALEDKSVKLLPKRYTREPYGIGFRKGKGAGKLKEALDGAINNMRQRNELSTLHRKWLGSKYAWDK